MGLLLCVLLKIPLIRYYIVNGIMILTTYSKFCVNNGQMFVYINVTKSFIYNPFHFSILLGSIENLKLTQQYAKQYRENMETLRQIGMTDAVSFSFLCHHNWGFWCVLVFGYNLSHKFSHLRNRRFGCLI